MTKEIIYVNNHLEYAHQSSFDSYRIINDLQTNSKNFIKQKYTKLDARILMEQKDLLEQQQLEENDNFYD